MSGAALPRRLKFLIGGLVALSIPILARAGWGLALSPAANFDWAILALLAIATVPFFVFFPLVNSVLLIGDVYILAIAMLYGPGPCVIATFAHTLSATLIAASRSKISWHKILFNTASTVCGAWLYSNVYLWLNPNLSSEISTLILPASILTVIFYTFNSVVTATAISWATGERIREFWARNYLPMAINFILSSVSASFIVVLHQFSRYAPLAVAPLVGLAWMWNNVIKAKAAEAEKHLTEQEQLYLRTVESLALAVDAKDQITHGHIRRVRAYAMALAGYCGITNKNELMAIETGSLLHDIGKLAVEDYILNKPGPLSELEYERMKVHVSAGDEILRQIQFPFPVADYVRFHHERWDGRGYPNGLKGEEIPLGARILAVADAFDAMRSSRPYKLSLDIQEVVTRLKMEAGAMYDPKLVDIFVEHVDELEAAAKEATQNITEQSLRKYFTKIEYQEASREPHILTSKIVQTSANELIQLSEFCSSHGKYLELPEICRIISSRIERLVPFATCAFFIDTRQHTLKPAFVAGGLSEILSQLIIELGKGISGWVAAYRQPLISTKPALEFQGCQGDFSALTGALVVPLVAGDSCFGTISLYSDAPTIYTRTHQELLQTIACIVAPVLGEARDGRESEKVVNAVDSTTRTHSSAYLSVVGPGLVAAAEQNKAPLCLLNLEVNNLRQIERVYGPASADSIMSKVAETFRIDLRDTDVLVRFGTQGFVAMLPGVRQDQALRWAQRLQQRTRSITIGTGPGQGTFASCQVAVAAFPQDGSDIYALIATAQQSLAAQSKPRTAPAEEPPSSVIGFPPRN
jgi:diguanylate cyclase (GGDEF)-like protein/putative nucleotidyltransferase with HDIG domain